MSTPAKIYRRMNGGFGASCDGVKDTGHHITGKVGGKTFFFTVWSATDPDIVICRDVSRKLAEKAITADWRVEERA